MQWCLMLSLPLLTCPLALILTASAASPTAALSRAASPRAAPPSSTLTGATGQLSWTITPTHPPAQQGFTIIGRSPSWTVTHQADAQLQPSHTLRVDADGTRHEVRYHTQNGTITGATVTDAAGEHELTQVGLWDADSIDVRLGQQVAQGAQTVRFAAIDLDGPKIYNFAAQVVDHTTCGHQPCTAVELQLTGLLRLVGPTWRYWVGADGELLRFEGPAGDFTAPAARTTGGAP